MRTYIDEAGIFTDPQLSNTHKVSVVGSLTIPDYSYAAVCDLLDNMKARWGATGEIKGSQLMEDQVRSLVEELTAHHVLFSAVIVDSKFCSPTSIASHKANFAAKILASISPHHHPDFVKKLRSLSSMIAEISDQLYVQSLAMTSIIHRSHQLSTLFYVQRTPSELAQFQWIVDAKQKNLTPTEKWWKDMLGPCLQGMSRTDPLQMLRGADYSHYNQFSDDKMQGAGSVNKIIKDFGFRDSASEKGLQLVDILTTSLRRALNQKFQIEGWRGIGRLMIHMRNQNLLSIVLEGDIPTTRSVPYYHVIETLNKEAREMLT